MKTISLGDTVEVAGTDLACTAQVSTKLFRRRKVVGCAKFTRGEPAVGSYAPAVADTGEVAVVKVGRGGKTSAAFRRRPAGAGSRARTFNITVGEVLFLAGTEIACAVNRLDGKPAVVCYVKQATGAPRPGTFGFLLSSKLAAAVSFDATGKSKTLFARRHGR